MHHHLLRLPAAAGLRIVLAVAVGAAAAGSRPAAGHTAAPVPAPSSGKLLLINGNRAVVTGSGGGRPPTAVLSGTGGSLLSLRLGGTSYAIPAAALPYLGHGLDPSLFDISALADADAAARLPVTVHYRGRIPVLPGVTITSAAAGVGRGYLTEASARTFGAALGHQFTLDHAHASYGTDGLFARGVSISLAGPAPARSASPFSIGRPQYRMETLTVDGTNLAGKPDTGDEVLLANVDDSGLLDINDAEAPFYHGVARFSVPVGHYFALGYFFGPSANGSPFPVTHALDVLPQFTVSRATTVHMAERAADSKITMVTPRRAAVLDTAFDVIRSPRRGAPASFQFNNFGFIGGDFPIWVSPTTTRPTVGTLQTVTNEWLASPPGRGTPYQYNLAYQNQGGLVTPQRYLVRAATLATVDARYYLAGNGGFLSRVSAFPVQDGSLSFTYDPIPVPGNLIEYTSASPGLIWTTSFYANSQGYPGSLLQSDPSRVYRPGQRVAEDWNAYPLHPAPDVKVIGAVGASSVYATVASASRSGDQLTLVYTPFSDNTPGHLGNGFDSSDGSTGVTGRYEIDQDGRKIAGGNAVTAAGGWPAITVQAALSPRPSTIRFTLDASMNATPNDLSGQSQTTWTWRSAHESGDVLPFSSGWLCANHTLECRVEPLLTLRYAVAGMAPDGVAPAGRQVLDLAVGHLQLARAARIVGAHVAVSFDGGRTWRAAWITSCGAGNFRATFAAPTGAYVTLRTTATDAAGGQISETIARAYRISAS
jgi:hypothetical protein